MASLSSIFNQACNQACSLAAVYPKNMSNYDDCTPGCYGTIPDGVWTKQGNIAPDFVSSFTLPTPGAYTGPGSWSSLKLVTTNMVMQGGVWVVDDGGEGGGQLGVQFSSSSDEMFHVATGGLYVQEIDLDIITQISGAVMQRKNYNQLRFVVKLISANSYVSFGGIAKNASTIITGSAQALQDAVAGQISGQITIAQTNITDINQTIYAGSQLVPVGMQLVEVSEHHGIEVNNESQ
jgi:hypothetical protein